MALKEYKTDIYHFFKDEYGRHHGDCFWFWSNGAIWTQSHYVLGHRHGEFIRYDKSGNIIEHALYDMGKQLAVNISSLSEEDRVFMTLKHGYRFFCNSRFE